MLLRMYQQQVVISCQAVLLGQKTCNMEQKRPRFWYGVQNLIIGGGNISKESPPARWFVMAAFAVVHPWQGRFHAR